MPGVADRDEQKRIHAARRVCELFRGRFSEAVGRKLIDDLGGELEAVDFVLNEDPVVVSNHLNENPDYVAEIRSDSKKIANLLENGIEYEICQFACESCVSTWWKKVPCRKQVSTCRRCKVKYNPVPEDKQWGWAKFVCPCGNEFHAFGEMGVTESKCYKCGISVPVDKVLPPRRRIGATKKKSNKPHQCNGVNCFSKHDDYIVQSMGKIDMTSYKSHHASHHNTITYNNNFGAAGNPGQGAGGKKGDKRSTASLGAAGDSAMSDSPAEPPVCVHPQSNRSGRRIRTPSSRHNSTGSTVKTFLSQGSLDTVSVAFTLHSIRE